MAENKRSDLDTPLAGQRRKLLKIDGDSVGAMAEKVARFFGTGEYLFWQTVFVAMWIALNAVAWAGRWDPYPFILLNLAFSTQAAYAAPLILLAQNRQEDRDRVSLAEDRRRSEQTKADTEFLARELASVRLAVGEGVTRDYLRHELEDLTELIERLESKIDDEWASRRREAQGADSNRHLEKPRHGADHDDD
ncbi:DUF1003 domain-containing protein [Corynebacterium mendelii]|uniref:DUF1003 domain-containing protein n=1 Tax=Corynebacterium mendelii TaxID=2765362 RepID=A0A939IYP6_9CORY|nr:DUF1003 domain-containing protein [Corynebacterium mendelii]MBN9644887.1 DUF1003 domain-containing protein [Corynebacterium mendelii]